MGAMLNLDGVRVRPMLLYMCVKLLLFIINSRCYVIMRYCALVPNFDGWSFWMYVVILMAGPLWMCVAILMAGPLWTYVAILMAGP